MIAYLLEVAFLHIIFYTIYFAFLRKESQQSLKRFFLLGSVFVSLTVPFISIPLPSITDPVLQGAGNIPFLDEVVVGPETTKTSAISFFSMIPFQSVYLVTSGILLMISVFSLLQIALLYFKSRTEVIDNIQVRVHPSVRRSFSFFRLIFIGERNRTIIAHEKAHGTLLHSVDIIVLNIFRALFWWLPTSWIVLREMKLIHEYQADDIAATEKNIEEYRRILISASMAPLGMNLASSFHEGALLKRLNAMKKTKKHISKWKIGMLGMLVAGVVLTFSCSEEMAGNNEVLTRVDQPPEFPGGMAKFYEYIGQNLKYPDQARRLGVEGRVYVQFVVNKDGSVGDVIAVKGIGAGCDAEAVNVLKNSPKFNPGLHNSKVVRVQMVLPIDFKLNADGENTKLEKLEIEPI